jgi:hypothetical protein
LGSARDTVITRGKEPRNHSDEEHHMNITHIVRHGLMLPLSEDVVLVEFIDIIGKLEMNRVAEFGSAALSEFDA